MDDYGVPIRIVELVLEQITDPREMVRLKAVSKKWSSIIDKMLPFANWKKYCLDEIRAFALLSIISVISSELKIKNYRNISDPRFWYDLYYHYQKLLRFKNSHQLSNLETTKIRLRDEEKVTCCDVWFHLIVLGTNHGNIYIFTNPNYRFLHSVHQLSNTSIKQVKFWYNGDFKAHIVSLTRLDLLNFWNVKDRKNNNPDRIYLANRICTGTVQNLYIGSNRTVIKYALNDKNKVDISSAVELDLVEGEKIVDMSSRESKIFVVTRKEFQIHLYILEDMAISENGRSLRIRFKIESPPLSIKTLDIHAYATSSRTVICTQEQAINMFNPSTNAWTSHFFTKDKGVLVNCLIMHGNYLIIGLNNGKVGFRYLENIIDLSNADHIFKNKIVAFKITTEPIIDVKVVQTNRKLKILAITPSTIFMISI